MVILLVVKRKVLGSGLDGSDVISVRRDICSAASHIRVNFPGADASQRGDLFILVRWVFGSDRFCAVLLAQLTGSHGSAGLQETLHFHFWELLRLAHVTHLHTSHKNAVLERI